MRLRADNSKIIRRVVAVIVLVVTVTLSITIGNIVVKNNEKVKAAEPSGENAGKLYNVVLSAEVDLPIIMYHSVNNYKPNLYNVTPAMFENDLKFILAAGYTPVFLSEITRFTEGTGQLPRKPIILSFDDGFYNNYSNVLPILKKHNAKIVLSIVGMYTDKERGAEVRKNTYSYLNDSEIGKMSDSGLVEFCNHTYDLHYIGKRKGVRPVAGETAKDYEDMLINDTIKCENVAKRCGIQFSGYTYPYGYFSKLTEKILVKHGYKAILTCCEGMNKISKGNMSALRELKRFNRPCNISTESFFKNRVKINLVNPR